MHTLNLSSRIFIPTINIFRAEKSATKTQYDQTYADLFSISTDISFSNDKEKLLFKATRMKNKTASKKY